MVIKNWKDFLSCSESGRKRSLCSNLSTNGTVRRKHCLPLSPGKVLLKEQKSIRLSQVHKNQQLKSAKLIWRPEKLSVYYCPLLLTRKREKIAKASCDRDLFAGHFCAWGPGVHGCRRECAVLGLGSERQSRGSDPATCIHSSLYKYRHWRIIFGPLRATPSQTNARIGIRKCPNTTPAFIHI